MECTEPTSTATSCATSITRISNPSSPLETLVPDISSNYFQSSDPVSTSIPENTRGGEGGSQGSVVIGAVAGMLAGVLVILIAVAIVCLTVAVCVNKRRRKGIENTAKESIGGLANPVYTTCTAILDQAVKTDNKFTNPTYAPSAIGQTIKTDDRFTNPTYSPTVSGHAVKTDDRFTNPTYSTTAVGQITPALQQYRSPSDPRRAADKDPPQYAVLEDPTSMNQPRDYEEIYNFAPPNSSPALVAASCSKLASLSHSSKLPQPASNVNLPPTAEQPYCDSPILEHTYSQLDRYLLVGNEVPNLLYSNLLQGEEEGGVAAGSSYSHLLHGLGGGDKEQQGETGAMTQHTYSHLVRDGGEHDTTQTGASESAYSHISDCHT